LRLAAILFFQVPQSFIHGQDADGVFVAKFERGIEPEHERVAAALFCVPRRGAIA